MKKLLVLLVVAFAVIAIPFSASATCAYYGKVNYTVAYTTGMYVYITPLNNGVIPPPFYVYYWIPTSSTTSAYSAIVQSALVAMPSNTAVYVVGNAASCPSTGTARYGGYATQVNLVPGY